MSIFARVRTIIRKQFVSGLLVTVPVIITYFVLSFLFSALDGLLNPVMHSLLGYNIPGLGAVVTILLILLTGIITTNFVGARLYYVSDRILAKMPLVRIVYTATKQLVDSVLAPNVKAFSEVVLVEYPRPGMYAIGLLSIRRRLIREAGEMDMLAVFVPSTPTPFTGMLVLVPESDVWRLDLSVEDAVKILVSGGIAGPELIHMSAAPKNHEVSDASGEFVG